MVAIPHEVTVDDLVCAMRNVVDVTTADGKLNLYINANLILFWCSRVPDGDPNNDHHAIILDVRAELKAIAIEVRDAAKTAIEKPTFDTAPLDKAYDSLRKTTLYFCQLVEPQLVPVLEISL